MGVADRHGKGRIEIVEWGSETCLGGAIFSGQDGDVVKGDAAPALLANDRLQQQLRCPAPQQPILASFEDAKAIKVGGFFSAQQIGRCLPTGQVWMSRDGLIKPVDHDS